MWGSHGPCVAQDDWWQLREPEEEARLVKDVYTDGIATGGRSLGNVCMNDLYHGTEKGQF